MRRGGRSGEKLSVMWMQPCAGRVMNEGSRPGGEARGLAGCVSTEGPRTSRALAAGQLP